MEKMKSVVKKELCVSCGCCIKVCPKDAIEVRWNICTYQSGFMYLMWKMCN